MYVLSLIIKIVFIINGTIPIYLSVLNFVCYKLKYNHWIWTHKFSAYLLSKNIFKKANHNYLWSKCTLVGSIIIIKKNIINSNVFMVPKN